MALFKLAWCVFFCDYAVLYFILRNWVAWYKKICPPSFIVILISLSYAWLPLGVVYSIRREYHHRVKAISIPNELIAQQAVSAYNQREQQIRWARLQTPSAFTEWANVTRPLGAGIQQLRNFKARLHFGIAATYNTLTPAQRDEIDEEIVEGARRPNRIAKPVMRIFEVYTLGLGGCWAYTIIEPTLRTSLNMRLMDLYVVILLATLRTYM
ncbi:hypothetical protein F4679DRAFT_87996 [Xylaria curta]|nr:hypothetical protein F4679DRAFT_87996 [Xylaria curta]